MKTVLIVGGYGQFGGRLSRRLSTLENTAVLVAGRRTQKAEALCRDIGGNVKPTKFDRNDDLHSQLKTLSPNIVVDAAGPFQNVFDTGYDLANTCISLGIHYIDLSDSGEFTKGITALDSDATSQNVAVISGASSVPALSAAVVDHASADFKRIKSIEGGISPGGKIDIGLSVTQAVLSYLGKPLRIFRDQEWVTENGFSRQHKFSVSVPGEKPLTRRYGLCDAPDLLLFPDQYPGVETVRFHGSTELGIIHTALRGLAWLQKRGIVRNLQNHAKLFAWCGTQLGRFASERGCMYMRISGTDKRGKAAATQWNLIASDGDGPFIPILAAEILIKRWLDTAPSPGARSAAGEISLAEFEHLFDGLSIKTAFSSTDQSPVLFENVLGESFQALPDVLKDGHNVFNFKTLSGKVDVVRGKNLIAILIAKLFGFPPTQSDATIKVSMDRQGEQEVWIRHINETAFKSTFTQVVTAGEVYEKFGPVKFKVNLRLDQDRLHYDLVSARVLGVPLPKFFLPKSNTHERVESGKFVFDVDVHLPIFGRLIRYTGQLS